jgi:hypothetical protein
MATATKRKKVPAKVAIVTKRANKARTKPKPREKTVTDKDKETTAKEAEIAKHDAAARRKETEQKEALAGGAQGAYSATTVSVPPADMLTEQEKDTSGDVPGVGPASASEGSPGPAETIEDLGIGPREPYPEGGAAPPEAPVAARKKELR